MLNIRHSSLFSFGRRMQFAFWIVLFSFVSYISATALGWPQTVLRGMLIFGCHILNFYVCYSWLVPHYIEQKKYAPAIISIIVLMMVLTSLRFYFIEQYEVLGEVALRLRPAGRLAFILFSEFAVSGFAILLRLAVNHEENKRKITEMEKIQLETELRFLKAQMSPHFLFNTINNIYSLTLIKSDKAPDALMKLSDLLRYLLYESQKKVPLQKEVETLHTYVELFQLRYEDPLNLKISNEVYEKDVLIEPLLLIPLLENAVKHSGLGISAHAYAIMKINMENGALFICTNNSKIHPLLTSEASGIGLNNIKKRLQMLYPDQHSFEIQEDKNQFIVTLQIAGI